jgi:hypothetical protein
MLSTRPSGRVRNSWLRNPFGGLSGAAVTKQRRRLAELRSKDRELAGQREAVLNVAGNV